MIATLVGPALGGTLGAMAQGAAQAAQEGEEMSITDELREWAGKPDGYDVWTPRDHKRLIAIADRIDAEHERAVAAAHSNGVTEYGSMVARGYVKLPVDADGVPIRVGDVMESPYSGKTCKAKSLTLKSDGTWMMGCGYWDLSKMVHHHETTVEDVLADYRGAAIELHTEYLRTDMSFEDFSAAADRLDADYAKRLRLADDAE